MRSRVNPDGSWTVYREDLPAPTEAEYLFVARPAGLRMALLLPRCARGDWKADFGKWRDDVAAYLRRRQEPAHG